LRVGNSFASTSVSKLRKLHLLNYSDLTKESNLKILLFRIIMYVMYYALLLR
jgi:hypothetical protein